MKRIQTAPVLAAIACLFVLFCTAVYFAEPKLPGQTRQTQEAEQTQRSDGTAERPAASGKVNLNTATAAELAELPGIGQTLAERIIDYREANGGISSLEDLTAVKGLGEKRIDAIRDYITLEDANENTGSR